MLDTQKYIWKPKIIVNKIDSTKSVFEVQYLPRGFGHTLGNALRRLVLGYDIGWAFTWLKIKWFTHEYSTIDWVRESVIDIMLNVKKLRFKMDESAEKMQWTSQRFKWVGQYFSSDLKLPSGVELLNDEVYLFEITDSNVELIVDFRIEKWYGYYNIDFLKRREEKNEDQEIGYLLIDNDFKAVEYVKYDVQEIIDDFQWSKKDNLVLEIKTISDKISPQELLSFAWEILSRYSKLFVFDDAYIDKSAFVEYEEMEEPVVKVQEETSARTIPIDALPLSERTRNALIKNNILYVEDLEKKRKAELLTMKWVGRKALDEIIQALENIGRTLQ